MVDPYRREAWRAEVRAWRAESRGRIHDCRPGIFEHSRHSVYLLWHLNSVWCLDSTQQSGGSQQENARSQYLWCTGYVIRGSRSQIRGAGSEIRQDPSPNLPLHVGIPVRIPIPRQSWQTRTLRLGAKCLVYLLPLRGEKRQLGLRHLAAERHIERGSQLQNYPYPTIWKKSLKSCNAFWSSGRCCFRKLWRSRAQRNDKLTNKKLNIFSPSPGSVRSPSRIKLGWCVHMITLTNSLAERKRIGMVSVHLSVAVPSGIYSELLTRASVDTASVCFGPAVQEPIHLFLSVVQVSCNVYSYWDGQELASSTLDSDSSYWVGVKYTSVINLLFVI